MAYMVKITKNKLRCETVDPHLGHITSRWVSCAIESIGSNGREVRSVQKASRSADTDWQRRAAIPGEKGYTK
jgi:hypothetical protein